MVVDTSAVLAVLFAEPGYERVAGVLNANAGRLKMSTVNYAETLILLRQRQPRGYAELVGRLEMSGLELVAPTALEAEVAADARHRFPLNLGDCFAYALAKGLGEPILTLDRDFRAVDVEVILPAG